METPTSTPRSDVSSGPAQAARRNVELKARLDSLESARRIAGRLATQPLERQRQTDTYFHCGNGRLKLREIDGEQAQLIWYVRPDAAEAKASHYHLTPVVEPEALKESLAGALGVRAVVHKQREIYLHHNVRIHLDDVRGLGYFLEFEAVLDPEDEEATGHEQVERLIEQFDIRTNDLLTNSYGDMC